MAVTYLTLAPNAMIVEIDMDYEKVVREIACANAMHAHLVELPALSGLQHFGLRHIVRVWKP